MTKLKVKGIYSTSLSKLLKDEGHTIVDSSEEISERLDIKNTEEEADVSIRDKKRKNGIKIKGDNSKGIVEFLKKSFPFIFISKKSPGTLYKGVVFKIEEGRAKLELGGKIGILFFEDSDEYLEPGDEVIVQEKGKKDSKPLLTTQLRFFSDSLVLIEYGYNKVSKNISDPDERERLRNLNEEIKLNDWGILWKSKAQEKSNEELKREVDALLDKKDEILKEAREREKPGLVKRGKTCYQLDFGLEVKQELDRIRREITPTIGNHHSLKSGDYSNMVDLAERFLAEIGDKANIVLEKCLDDKMVKEGDVYKIEHIKPDKKVFMKGKVQKRDDEKLVVKRRMKSKGDYDGLNMPIEKGDYALTYIEEEAPYILHEYYRKDGELKGKYISINTGIEMYPWYAKYLDLGVDIIEKDGEKEIIDLDELKEFRDKGRVSQKLFKAAVKRSKKVKRRLGG